MNALDLTPLVDEPHTVARWVRDRARLSPASTAIDDRGVRIDYATLAERVAGFVEALRAAGYGAGDRVATVSGNSIDHVVAFFGCASVGAAFVPLSWRAAAGELAALIARARPQLLLVDDEYAGLVAEARTHLDTVPPVAVLGGHTSERVLPPRHPDHGAAPRPRGGRDDDPLLVIFTSGSEASPKGVVLTHANCFWNNLALAGAIEIAAHDVVLTMLPQFHIAAWNVQPLLAWWAGATVVLERSFQPSRVLPLIADRGVTVMMGVPTQYRLLADDPRFAASDLSSLRVAQVGGATMPADLHATWRARGVRLAQGYGLTEAGPNVLTVPGETDDLVGTVGRPYRHVDVALIDPETGDLLDGAATGELVVQGPSVTPGYLDDPDATARAFVGGWLRTGDLAERDARGVYRIVDRRKEIFISGGENVAPAEVEAALRTHPLVVDAAVVPVPDRVWGERGVAFVTLAQRAVVGEDELDAHARGILSSVKVPVRFVVVDELPRSAVDKIARRRLRERAAALVLEPRRIDEHSR